MTDIERFLCEYRGVKNRIRELEHDLDEIKAKKQAQYDKLLETKKLKHDRITGGVMYDPVIEVVSKLVDVYAQREKRIADELSAANGKLAYIEDIVTQAGLNEIERRCIKLRYWEGLKFWVVAREMNSSERTVYRIRDAALEKLADRGSFFPI
jgi:DNA-directed RNA polymerase specialized sigma subunit